MCIEYRYFYIYIYLYIFYIKRDRARVAPGRARAAASCVRGVVAAVPGLFLVLGFGGPGCPRGLPGAGGHEAPVALAVLVDEAHFRLGQQLGQLLVRRRWGAGAGGRRGAHGQRWEEGSVDGVPAQDVQLHPRDDVLEVVLSGCAGVQAAVAQLQGAEQQALVRAQEALLGADLQGESDSGLRPPLSRQGAGSGLGPPCSPGRERAQGWAPAARQLSARPPVAVPCGHRGECPHSKKNPHAGF